MNITIINNGTSYLGELHELLENHNVTIRSWNNGFHLEPSTDLIILTGGHHISIVKNTHFYQRELEFISRYTKPLLGICLGAELLAYAHNAKLKRLEEKEHGIFTIEKLHNDELFNGVDKFGVYENHRWVISNLSQNLVGLAKSANGYEIIKHKHLPLYGFQFHPEMMVDKTCGTQLFSNFLQIVENFK
jgi:GMP synthase-like glutamine amidotransferase